ncbi:MAG: DUF4388 domain-containing protein [Chitinispirillaceae bacterium]
MRKTVWILVCLIGICLPNLLSARQIEITEKARVHTAPDVSSSYTGIAQKGEKLPLLKKEGKWYKTEFQEAQGWVQTSKAEAVDGDDVFSDQDVSMVPPVPAEQGKKQKYVKITTTPTRVLYYLSPDSPILTMARKGDVLPLIGEGDSWVKIGFEDTSGWVDKRHAEIVDAPTSSVILDDAKILLLALIVGGAIVLIVIGIITIRHLRSERNRKVYVQKNALILARESKMVQYMLTNHAAPIENCFSEIGFNINVARDIVVARNNIAHCLPDLVLVDWRFEPGIFSKIEHLFAKHPSTKNVHFLFYNVPDPSNAPRSRVLTNVMFLGITLSDRDIFKVVTPLIISHEQKESKKIQKSVQRCALEGNIEGGNLLEVLQFIEIGSKTGCLMIETKGPFGLVYFNNGRIIYAAATNSQGRQAVYSILNLKAGKFRFILNKHPRVANLHLSTLSVLMEWTKKLDEAHER